MTSLLDTSRAASRPISVPLARKSAVREALLRVSLLPSLVLILVFGIYPVFKAGYISLFNWSIIKQGFIGLQNYRTLLGDPEFWQSLWVTVFYVIATVPLTMLVSLVLAYLLFQPISGRAAFRTLYFLPYVTSVVPAAMVWQWIFNFQSGILNFGAKGIFQLLAGLLRFAGPPPGVYIWVILAGAWLIFLLVTLRRRSGFANLLLMLAAGLMLALGILYASNPAALDVTITQLETFFPVRWLQEPRGILLFLGKKWGFTPPTWLQGPSMALIAVSIVSMWHFIGYDVVIYLAGLFNVPPTWTKPRASTALQRSKIFWRITFPLLSPTTFFLLIISTIGAFRSFTMFYVLTQGGPLKTTTSVTYMVYDRFYTAARWGYASAIAFVLFGIILAMTLVNQRLVGRRVFYQ